MATWMIHLRVADRLLDRIPDLEPIEFIMGNMAPDSGVPNKDWTQFSPSTAVSHFRRDDGSGKKKIDLEPFRDRYFSPARRSCYTARQDAFYLGYYTHLLTDICWSDWVAWPTRARFPDASWGEIKKDWYDLDKLYLRNRPGFRAFRAYLGSVGFVNTYMDIFAPDAFDNRRSYITSFYLEEAEDLDRAYTYLTEAEIDRFIDRCVSHILEVLK